MIGRIHPKVAAHDLVFAPDGRTVWVSSASAPYVSVLNASSGRLVERVPAGPGPQHIAFGAYTRAPVFISSGYGSTLEAVNVATRKVLRRVAVPVRVIQRCDCGRVRRHLVPAQRRGHGVHGQLAPLDGRDRGAACPRRGDQRLVRSCHGCGQLVRARVSQGFRSNEPRRALANPTRSRRATQ